MLLSHSSIPRATGVHEVVLTETSALFTSHSDVRYFNGLSGSHRGGGGEERLPGKYGSLKCRGEQKKTTCQIDDCHKIVCIFRVKFTEVGDFYSPWDSSKRQSGTQHSPELVLTSASGVNYSLLKGLDGRSVTREAFITAIWGKILALLVMMWSLQALQGHFRRCTAILFIRDHQTKSALLTSPHPRDGD